MRAVISTLACVVPLAIASVTGARADTCQELAQAISMAPSGFEQARSGSYDSETESWDSAYRIAGTSECSVFSGDDGELPYLYCTRDFTSMGDATAAAEALARDVGSCAAAAGPVEESPWRDSQYTGRSGSSTTRAKTIAVPSADANRDVRIALTARCSVRNYSSRRPPCMAAISVQLDTD
jgi:hypothetical protein